MKRILAHALLVVAVLCVFGLAAVLLVMYKKQPVTTPPTRVVPKVNVVQVKVGTVAVEIDANGTVRPEKTTQLTSQVSGQIMRVSDNFKEGGFFAEDDVLLWIDPMAYETQLANARAQLAAAKLALETEQAASQRAERDWQRLKSGEPSDLAARIPQLAKAKADVAAAEAGLQSALHDLSHTEIRAPYAGRVRAKMADVGQSVSALAVVLADIYAIDYAEVVLPLPQEDAWFVEVPKDGSSSDIEVTLSGNVGAGERATWRGVIDRSSGIVDEGNRFVRIIVRVEDPYRLKPGNAGAPLQVGQFVTATIPGRAVDDAFEVPREAILPGGIVLVVEPVANDLTEATIERRTVTMIRKQGGRVIVTDGVRDGDYVSVTRLQFYADDMAVSASMVDPGRELNPGNLLQQVLR